MFGGCPKTSNRETFGHCRWYVAAVFHRCLLDVVLVLTEFGYLVVEGACAEFVHTLSIESCTLFTHEKFEGANDEFGCICGWHCVGVGFVAFKSASPKHMYKITA